MTERRDKHPPGTNLILIILMCGLVYLMWMVLHHRPLDEPKSENPWPDLRIDINHAPAAHLQVLPGIGPQLADRIVEFREEHGPYRTLEDLQQVRFIGPNVISRIEPYVVVTPPTQLLNTDMLVPNDAVTTGP